MIKLKCKNISSIWTVLQMVLSCISIMWVSNVEFFAGKLRLTVTGGILMNVVEIISNIIIGAGSCRIGHL